MIIAWKFIRKLFRMLARRFPWVRGVAEKVRHTTLPGFDGLTIWEVLVFVAQKMQEDVLTVRARSVAFTFLLAVFPAIIFLFSLVPYIPVPHLKDSLVAVMHDVTPDSIFKLLSRAIDEAASKQHSGFLSFGLFMSLFISTNGAMGLMASFDKASEYSFKRSQLRQRWVALQLTVILFVLLLFSIALIVAGNKLIILALMKFHRLSNFNVMLFTTLKFLIILLLFFNSISIIYRYGPAHVKKWKFISPGSTLATFLSISVSLGFSFFVNKFGGPSRLFGSLGTIIALQIWIYLNSFALLLGFELNASIEQKKAQKEQSIEEEAEEEDLGNEILETSVVG